MELGDWMPQSDWGRRIYEQGQQEGEAGETRALLTIFEARGIPLTAEQLARVESCHDTRRLEEWIRRAVTATTATEVLDET